MGVLIGVDMRFRDRLSSGGWSRERYGYDSGLVMQIEVERESSERTIRNRFEVRYDQDERVASIAGAPLSGGPLRTLYRRAAPRDVKQALKLVERRLPELIVEWAQRLMPDDDVYCVGIIYSYDEPYDPSPSLALGTESERAGWMSELRGEDLRAMLWHPGEFALLDSMPAELQDDQELTEAAATLEREWRATDDKESVRKLLLRCAKALRAAGTLGFLSKAYGPVVLAVDDELADLESNLKLCATREDQARLEAV
jgi:hypothetical protein